MDSNNKKIITTALAADFIAVLLFIFALQTKISIIILLLYIINLLLYLSSCAAILKNINKTNKTIFISTFIVTLRSVYKELHADHETGTADNK